MDDRSKMLAMFERELGHFGISISAAEKAEIERDAEEKIRSILDSSTGFRKEHLLAQSGSPTAVPSQTLPVPPTDTAHRAEQRRPGNTLLQQMPGFGEGRDPALDAGTAPPSTPSDKPKSAAGDAATKPPRLSNSVSTAGKSHPSHSLSPTIPPAGVPVMSTPSMSMNQQRPQARSAPSPPPLSAALSTGVDSPLLSVEGDGTPPILSPGKSAALDSTYDFDDDAGVPVKSTSPTSMNQQRPQARSAPSPPPLSAALSTGIDSPLLSVEGDGTPPILSPANSTALDSSFDFDDDVAFDALGLESPKAAGVTAASSASMSARKHKANASSSPTVGGSTGDLHSSITHNEPNSDDDELGGLDEDESELDLDGPFPDLSDMEDDPEWKLVSNEGTEQKYWFNRYTGESRLTPPSSGEKRVGAVDCGASESSADEDLNLFAGFANANAAAERGGSDSRRESDVSGVDSLNTNHFDLDAFDDWDDAGGGGG